MKFTASLTIFFCLGALLRSQTPLPQPADRITGPISTSSLVVLPNTVLPAVAAATLSQPVDPALPMDHMILSLQASASQQAALQLLLTQQQTPSSPNFHKFLTPTEFASSFGVSQNDIKKVTSWLTYNGFQIDEIGANHLSITFSGSATQVASAFHTEIRQYIVNGESYFANASAPQIPMALAPVIQGFVKLHNFHSKPSIIGLKPVPQTQAGSQYTSSTSSHYLVPADYAVIYDLNPLFSSGFTGASQTIAVVGRSNIRPTDVATFRADYALPANTFTPVFATGNDPGIAGDSDTLEATLDVEWAGAVAPRANIKLVVAASTAATDGIDLAAQYAINNDLAPILSVSFGVCEAVVNNAFYNALWQQAAAQGMTVLVAAGDSGVAGCDSPTASTGTVKSVNGICSTPYDTCVGGTMFNDALNPGQYWFPGNNAVMGSAISYIPETAWNESALTTGGSGLAAGGGGISAVYVKPSWQTGPGVPADGHRDVPDVSLSAAQHDGYMILYNGVPSAIGGTSAATPSFAGIMALLAQKHGGAQGNVNPLLYSLAAQGSVSGTLPMFHDVNSGNNSVPGITGYVAATGYDLATGLGSVDATQLANNWGSLNNNFSFAASVLSVSVSPGHSASVTLNVTDIGAFTSPVTLSFSQLPSGILASFAPGTITGSGSSVISFTSGGTATSGTYAITVTATGGGLTRTATFNLVVVVATNCTLAATPVSLTVVQSQATSTKLVCGSAQGVFASNLALTVSGAPAGVTTSFSPASLTPGTGVSTLVVNASSVVTPGAYTLVVTATLPNASPAFSTTVNVPLTVNAPTTFNVMPSAKTVSFQQGGSGTLILTSVHSGAFNSSISFSTSGLPSTIATGLSSALVAAPGDGTVTISLQSLSTVPVGAYSMTVLAQGGGLVLRIPIAVQVTAAPAFNLTDSTAVLTLRQSNTATIPFTVGSLTNGFNLPVSFTVTGLPAGLTGVFSSPTLAAPGSGVSTLTLTASATANAGVSTFTVTANGGTITRAVNVKLTVTPAPAFSIGVSLPSFGMIAGGSLTETVSSAALYGFTGNVQLSTGVLPAGFIVSFLNATVSGANGTTTMTIQPLGSVVAGSYPITVIGTDPSTNITQTAIINLLVGNVTTTLGASSVSLSSNVAGTATITTVAHSYSGNVALSLADLPYGVTYTLSQTIIAGSGSSTLTVSAGANVIPGTYTVMVRSIADGVTSNNPLTLIIS